MGVPKSKFETSPTFNKIKDDPPRKRGILTLYIKNKK